MSRGARARLALIALAFVAILFVFVFPTRSYLAQRKQVSSAQHDVALLKQQNDKLQEQAIELQTRAAIEQMAREQFHRVFPGEQVYDVVPRCTDAVGYQYDNGSLTRLPYTRAVSVIDPPSEHDVEVLTELLGRPPRAGFEVVVRNARGEPAVIRNAPLFDDGTPMPTRYWLVDPDLSLRVARLESAGGVRAAEAAVAPEALGSADERYARERDAALAPDHAGPRPSGGVGGTARGVKCLHADYAYFLAGGDDPVGRWVEENLQ